jgi:AbrB family looped-hinge helix DNA binding protein
MSKVTSKLQLTIPKALAKRLRIRPGDEVNWSAVGDSLRVEPRASTVTPIDIPKRLRLFDEATRRQAGRQAQRRGHEESTDRGWNRDELYDRGFSR